ncbi:MAG: SpoIIE family protein phosphatase, partial [Trichodesmium sp. St2_bin2_1]|nr:SpoIIE family protein phosphatase [Trichodesmium sp. St2_bin2_1]
IVQAVGRTFRATEGILWPVSGDRLISKPVSYQSPESAENNFPINKELEELLLQVVQSSETYFEEGSNKNSCKLIVPLIYQKDLLAVLALNQEDRNNFWSSEDIEFIKSVLQQAALALSQAKLYQRTRELAEQMSNELEVARQIQSNLLRQSWPDFDKFRIQACCYPAREVGGDFFEVYTHPQGEIWLALGDVSGKGVPAALFMASAISVMRRELSQENPAEPYEVMKNLNSSLSDDLISNNCFITMVLARYTPETGSLAYANAGHIYPLVWSKTALPTTGNTDSEQVPNFLKDRGIPLGILPIWRGKAGTVDLDSGDVFLLTSDGITEATVVQEATDSGVATRVMLQQEGLWKLLKQHKSQLDLNSLLAYIRADNQVQEDDQTILSLEVL